MCSTKGSNIIEIPNLEYSPDPRGIGFVYYDCMLKNRDKIAQIYGPTGEKDTFNEVLRRSIRVAIAMKMMHIKPGDYVSICTFNHLDSCTPVIASFFVGSIMAAVDPTLSLEDTILLLKQVPPKIIFVQPEAVEMIEKVIEALKSDTKIIVFGNTEKHIPFSDFLRPSADESNFKPFAAKNVKDTAIIFFSSGTTGLPKAACINHHSVLCCTINFMRYGFNLSLGFTYAPPYWTVFLSNLTKSIMSGGARLVYPKYDPNNPWKIFDYKLTSMFLPTMQVSTMLSQGRPENLDISSLEDIYIGAGTIMLDQILKIKELFHEARVHLVYGLTETFGPLTIFKPGNKTDRKFISEKPSSVGMGVPGISYKIVDLETEEVLGRNQKGELRIKSEMAFNGYLNCDSSEVYDSDGWLKTGDAAYYDEDNCFYILDRVKETFKFQGWHISPAILESVLLTHPAVEIAVVIGIPHEIDGDHPLGLVQLKPSHQEVAPQEIEKYVEQKVQDRQRLRAGVKIVNNFPTTPSGKVNRNKLKQMVLDRKL